LVGSETEEVRSVFKYIFSFSLTEGGLLIEDAETQRRKIKAKLLMSDLPPVAPAHVDVAGAIL
jgi:hypothetical protein